MSSIIKVRSRLFSSSFPDDDQTQKALLLTGDVGISTGDRRVVRFTPSLQKLFDRSPHLYQSSLATLSKTDGSSKTYAYLYRKSEDHSTEKSPPRAFSTILSYSSFDLVVYIGSHLLSMILTLAIRIPTYLDQRFANSGCQLYRRDPQ
jgi:hypothetical protein